jgi:hypothetical protein
MLSAPYISALLLHTVMIDVKRGLGKDARARQVRAARGKNIGSATFYMHPPGVIIISPAAARKRRGKSIPRQFIISAPLRV